MLWALEEQFWLCGAEEAKASLDADCLMALPPPGGVMRGAAMIADSLAGAPRWTSVAMTQRNETRSREDVAVLVYAAHGRRSGADDYRALCSSTWLATGGVWRLVQHHQTPLPAG
ncbi:MAG: DUF4440 domain-containing protein [Alphaproteobacteria bacterium]|nr:DUF4440 domain-containing protein [Alphaproteobacteria bacterium]